MLRVLLSDLKVVLGYHLQVVLIFFLLTDIRYVRPSRPNVEMSRPRSIQAGYVLTMLDRKQCSKREDIF